jgi:uncharacterized SAM-dependent methyltransferase
MHEALPRFWTILAKRSSRVAQPQKIVPARYFYDRRGSELFEEITRLAEYYTTAPRPRFCARIEMISPGWPDTAAR